MLVEMMSTTTIDSSCSDAVVEEKPVAAAAAAADNVSWSQFAEWCRTPDRQSWRHLLRLAWQRSVHVDLACDSKRALCSRLAKTFAAVGGSYSVECVPIDSHLLDPVTHEPLTNPWTTTIGTTYNASTLLQLRASSNGGGGDDHRHLPRNAVAPNAVVLDPIQRRPIDVARSVPAYVVRDCIEQHFQEAGNRPAADDAMTTPTAEPWNIRSINDSSSTSCHVVNAAAVAPTPTLEPDIINTMLQYYRDFMQPASGQQPAVVAAEPYDGPPSAVDEADELYRACVDGNMERLDQLLSAAAAVDGGSRPDPSANDNAALRTAARAGNLPIVCRLLEDARVDATSDAGAAALRDACMNGYSDVVDRLLLRGADPNAFGFACLRLACVHDRFRVVARLLLDPRVDPSCMGNLAVRIASSRGHLSIVGLLMTDSRVDATAHRNQALRDACANGHLAVVQLLLYSIGDRVDSEILGISMSWAISNGHAGIVNMLLRDERVDPAEFENSALCVASEKGYLDIVERLLLDERVNRTYNTALLRASREGHRDIVRVLLAHEGTRSYESEQLFNSLLLCWSSADLVRPVRDRYRSRIGYTSASASSSCGGCICC